MRRIRFATIDDVFDAFPGLAGTVSAQQTGEAPLDFLGRSRDEGRAEEVLGLCPFVLPRREAIWWACRCLAADPDGIPPQERRAWEAAAAWVYVPDERRRQVAYEIAATADRAWATTWLVLAVAWSGGAMEPTAPHSAPPSPDLCAKTLRVALRLATALRGDGDRSVFVERCVNTAVEIGRDDGNITDEVRRFMRP